MRSASYWAVPIKLDLGTAASRKGYNWARVTSLAGRSPVSRRGVKEMNRCLERLQREFDSAGVRYEVIQHQSAYTAQHEAALAHVPGYSFAKSVIVFADGAPKHLVLSAPLRVELEAVRQHFGAKEVRLAREEELSRLFPDCEAGAMPALPDPAVSRISMDRRLLSQLEIVFEAGSHSEALKMAREDYMRLADSDVFEFAEAPRDQAATAADGRPARNWHLKLMVLPAMPRAEPREWAVLSGGAIVLLFLVAGAKRFLPWNAIATFLLGLAAGGLGFALTDSRNGRRRRALVRDKGGKYARITLRRVLGLIRRATGEARGRFYRWRHAGSAA
jgi:Ala-tRNA(Pro) deacylase